MSRLNPRATKRGACFSSLFFQISILMNPRISRKPAILPRRLCIVGLCHQSTVLSASFARMGHWVTTVGDDETAVTGISPRGSAVVEPKLVAMHRRVVSARHV